MRCFVPVALVALSVGILGCGETEQQRLDRLVPDALDTVKVSGKVLVDGEPIEKLWVTLHPKDPTIQVRPRGQTDAEGNFKLTTYAYGDGAPEGEWTITIEWLTYIKRASDWGGPDKLKNQYNDPKTTPFNVTVESGDPKGMELPTFELKLKGVEDKNPPPATKPGVGRGEK